MMKKLNDLFQEYRANPEAGLDPLLTGVRRYAASVLRDDDGVQEFLVKVWNELPNLKNDGSFLSWIFKRVRWFRHDCYDRRERDLLRPIPVKSNDEGEQLSDGEVLDNLALTAEQNAEPPKQTYTFFVDDLKIDDPVIEKCARLMLKGWTYERIAGQLNMNLSALKLRVKRYRDSHRGMCPLVM